MEPPCASASVFLTPSPIKVAQTVHKMPFSEKKGRFTVCTTHNGEQQKPSSSSPTPSASGDNSSPSRAVKRGRFLVSCLPCAAPCLGATLSLQEEEAAALLGPTTTATQCSAPAARGPNAAAAAAARVTPAAASQSPEPRRVRFSDADEPAAPSCARSHLQHQQPNGAAALSQPLQQLQQQGQDKCHKRQAPDVPRELKHTRSYCSGRFVVQEALSVPAAAAADGVAAAPALHRSVSAPECAAAAAAAVAAACADPFAAAQQLQCPNGSDSSSICSGSSGSDSPGCFALLGSASSSCADLMASHQLMSGVVFLQQQQQPHKQQQQQQLLAPQQGTTLQLPPAEYTAASAVGNNGSCSGGGLFPSVSVPLPLLGSTGCGALLGSGPGSVCSDDSTITSSLLSSSSGVGPCTLLGVTDPGASAGAAAANNNSSSSGSRAAGLRNTRSFAGCYSGGVDHLPSAAAAAAAAVAVGGAAHHHTTHGGHLGPKRSASVSYFRRGRFLVQTTL